MVTPLTEIQSVNNTVFVYLSTYFLLFSFFRKVENVFQKVGCAMLTQIAASEILQTRVLIVSTRRVSRLSTLVTAVKDAFALIISATVRQIA